jgi:hypothetical protein
MASRIADSEALAERCRKVGWDVTRANGGGVWKVSKPGGEIVTHIHQTYSDVKALHLVTATLRKAGLMEAENAIKGKRLTESRTRAKIAAEAAEKRGKELAAKASLTKAAGPYLVEAEDIELDWYVTPHPAPWMRWANVTPAIARHILDHANGDNRPIGPQTVGFYRDIILARLWHLTHQGLAFDTRGLCQDGQHRLEALCAAAALDEEIEAVPFAVFVGMDVNNFKVIDEGRMRNARQLFGKAGEKNDSILQTCVRLVHYVNDTSARQSARLRLPNQIVVDEFDADADNFRTAVAFGSAAARRLHCSAGAIAAAYYLICKRNGGIENSYVDAFFFGLTEGKLPGTRYMLDDTDPRQVLRRRFADLKLRVGKERRSSLSQVGMIITSWNNCVTNRNPRTLYFSDDAPIPEILKCDPGRGAAPEVFRTVIA